MLLSINSNKPLGVVLVLYSFNRIIIVGPPVEHGDLSSCSFLTLLTAPGMSGWLLPLHLGHYCTSSTSCLDSHYCSLQYSQLGKIDVYFSSSVVCLSPYSTMRTVIRDEAASSSSMSSGFYYKSYHFLSYICSKILLRLL